MLRKSSPVESCGNLKLSALMEETAIVKAILSVLTPEHRKASQFYTILKDTFPLAVQFPDFQKFIQEREKKQLQDAVVEELQEVHLCCDKEIIKQTLTLYQTLKFSQTVILIGPSGSGKTTCYSILAGALSRLASTSINSKVLKDSERYDRTCQPCWLDYLTTLCSPQDPHLCMSTGETILSPSQFSLLLEMTDLCDASPSVVTRCGLVYFKHTDVWKSIWNSEMDSDLSEILKSIPHGKLDK
uniref:Dynein heavy chain hydrolytic ATP-binding dynein motor region domain-containing protein n=1 Tax=Xiphophorus maculatus TaxID=8083 RepID=A0A3B5QCQ3_XIPMA